jgi:hypothetical protein
MARAAIRNEGGTCGREARDRPCRSQGQRHQTPDETKDNREAEAMTPKRLREILASELEKLEGIPARLIREVRDGTHGAHIRAALDAMEIAIVEVTGKSLDCDD